MSRSFSISRSIRLCLQPALLLLLATAARAHSSAPDSAEAQKAALGRTKIENALKNSRPEAELRAELEAIGFAPKHIDGALDYYRNEIKKRAVLSTVRASIVPGNAPMKGNPAAPVTLIEVSDFECPYCAHAQPTLKALAVQYGDNLRFAYKYFPMAAHNYARFAAAAARAAHVQGKFWQMHDYILDHQKEIEAMVGNDFAITASAVGLDRAKFGADYKALIRDQSWIEADIAEVKEWTVESTPAFFINGELIMGNQPIEKFRAAIDAALIAARKPAAAAPKPAPRPKAPAKKGK